jgi:hypothetical protein
MAERLSFSRRFQPADHLAALQMLVNRCPTSEEKKWLIVTAGSCGALSPEDAFVMMTANLLESA